MGQKIGRRRFLRTLGTGAAIVIGAACAPAAAPTAVPKTEPKPAAPAPAPTTAPVPAATTAPAAPKPTTAPAPAATAAAPAVVKPAAQGERLVVALGQWGTETPFAWRSAAAEKPLWDHMHDSLIVRDPATFKMKPSLATEWKPSADYKSWTIKLRQGVMFHENYGEMTAEDVKFTVEQNLKPGMPGGSAPFFRDQLTKIETPDKYTVVMYFKEPTWEVATHFAQRTGYQNITSKKYLESVGEDKAALHPIGTGPFRHVEGKQGDFHRFAAVPNHWRQTPGFKEMVIRRITDQASSIAGLRAGEIDIAQVTGDYLAQAKKAGLRIHEVPDATPYIIVLPGMTLPDKPDYSPQSPWAGDPKDSKSQENAKKVRLALNLAVNKQAIIDSLWQGFGKLSPYVPWYYPHEPGFSKDWKIPPYDPQKAKQLLAEAGYPNGFEITVSGQTQVIDGPDVMEAVALDWERLGLKVKRYKEDWGTFLPKVRARKTGVIAWPYGVPGPTDEATLLWQRTVWSKGTFYIFAESPEYDQKIETLLRELDPEKRGKLQGELGQKMYDDTRVVMLGVKSVTFAVSNKVKDWPTLFATLWENNFEYVTWSGQ